MECTVKAQQIGWTPMTVRLLLHMWGGGLSLFKSSLTVLWTLLTTSNITIVFIFFAQSEHFVMCKTRVCTIFAKHKVFCSVFLYRLWTFGVQKSLHMGLKTAPPLVQRVKCSCWFVSVSMQMQLAVSLSVYKKPRGQINVLRACAKTEGVCERKESSFTNPSADTRKN